MARYEQLIALIAECKPHKIIEVGTHNGARAILMCREALRYHAAVHYLGFDLFDKATLEINRQESNGKGAGDYAKASRELSLIRRDHIGFAFTLVKGNTRRTLHGQNIIGDFVFIDGGHSVETIRGDYEALKGSRLIAFDDYYTRGIDTEKFGCNAIVDALDPVIMPVVDHTRDGASICIAVVRR